MYVYLASPYLGCSNTSPIPEPGPSNSEPPLPLPLTFSCSAAMVAMGAAGSAINIREHTLVTDPNPNP